METQKERLEKELRFLDESLKADIISQEEYERAKERALSKLNNTSEDESHTKLGNNLEIEKKGGIDKPISEEAKHSDAQKFIDELKEEQPKSEVTIEKGVVKEKEIEQEVQKKKTSNWKSYFAVLLMIAVIVFLILSNINNKAKPVELSNKTVIISCYTDNDCAITGKLGKCKNPGTEQSECIYFDIVEANLSVITDKDCPICDADRMTGTLKNLYPGIIVNNIEYDSPLGKKLIVQLGIDSLPAYIFDKKITDATNYNKTKSIFAVKNDNYIVLATASGASFFFRRPEIKNKIDFYFIKNQSDIKAEASIDKVGNLFGDKITLNKIAVENKDMAGLKDSLAVTSYPFILINNQYKVGGIQSPEYIKEGFCKLNNLSECSQKLATSIG